MVELTNLNFISLNVNILILYIQWTDYKSQAIHYKSVLVENNIFLSNKIQQPSLLSENF